MHAIYANQPYLSRRVMMIMGAVAVGVALSTAEAQAQATGAFSADGLARIAQAAQGPVDRGEVAGVVTLISSAGETKVSAVGVQNLDTRVPMQRDTIFRIASMTKPICAVAALMLVEDGVVTLDQPVDAGWRPAMTSEKCVNFRQNA